MSSPTPAPGPRSMTVTVVWIQHGGELAWAVPIAEILRRQGIVVRFVSFLREMADAYEAAGWPSDFIGDIFSHDQHLSESSLIELENRYGPPALRCIAASDVHLHHLFGDDESAKIQIIGRALKFWERYFATHGIDAAIVRDQASFSTRCARHVAERLGTIRMIQLGAGPDDTRFALYDVDTGWNWSELDDELARGPLPLSQEREAAIEAFVAGRVQPNRARPMKLHLGIPLLLHLPVVLYRYWREECAVDRARDPVMLGVLRLRRELLTKRAMWRALRCLLRYDSPRDEPYVYFPLFHTEESIHLVNIRYWARRVEDLALQLAESLPIGHQLYIKEHPAILGDVPQAVLRRLGRHPQIRLISPEIPSQGLISRAKAVVVLEGTAGWETLLLRRPLVVLSAAPFYVRCPLVFHVKDICDMDRVLPTAIAAGAALYATRRNEWLWFIDCVLRTTPLGVLETFEFPHVTPQQAENLAAVAGALERKIRSPAPAFPKRVAAHG